MTHSIAEKRRVYLSCRAIFTGNNAQLRRQKKVKQLIDKRRAYLAHLLRDLGIAKVVEVSRILLENGVFESELRAKVQFPELFVSTPDRDAQHAESEQNAARSVAEALEDIVSLGDSEEGRICDEGEMAVEMQPEGEESRMPTMRARVSKADLQSLYPVYLPYKAQHSVLTTVQHTLEECLFEFGQKWLPAIVESNGWECPDAVELTKWTRLLIRRSERLPAHALTTTDHTLSSVLLATHPIRHTAVHRLPTTARGITELIGAAVKCAEVLQDNVRALQLEELRTEIGGKIEAMELNKNALEDFAARELADIQRRREELARLERETIENMKKHDNEHKSLVGSLVEESVRRIFAGDETQIGLEDGDEKSAEAKICDGSNDMTVQSLEDPDHACEN